VSDSDPNYDERGRWVRTDRPEMLSDRLGYPSSVGDKDWRRVKARREQPAEGTRPNPSDGDQS
jgi:hypothetical protein